VKFFQSLKSPRLGLIILAFIAFVALGLPDGLLGVGWPSIRGDFSIPLDAVGMLLLASVSGYMTSSFLNGILLTRMGVGRLLAASCFLTGVALIGLSIAPIFPAMMSGTRTRVGDHCAANTIGMEMTATGFGTAVIPSLMGVLARQISLEVIPIILLVVYAVLLAFYLLSVRLGKKRTLVAS
jgi:fucose permease